MIDFLFPFLPSNHSRLDCWMKNYLLSSFHGKIPRNLRHYYYVLSNKNLDINEPSIIEFIHQTEPVDIDCLLDSKIIKTLQKHSPSLHLFSSCFKVNLKKKKKIGNVNTYFLANL